MPFRKVTGSLVGAAVALMPALASAKGPGSRELGASDDFWQVALFTLLGVGGLMTISALGYLYRRERDLGWDFQKPDAGDHGDAH